jgi:hypothetical protein
MIFALGFPRFQPWNKAANWGLGISLKLPGEGRAEAADLGEREPKACRRD